LASVHARNLPMKARPGLAVALALMLLVAVGRAPIAAADLQHLEIVSKTGVHVFTVELAVTDEERAHGLMDRHALADGHGMLFKFEPDQVIRMWMHNTYVSLDMIFIRGDGRIVSIAENTTPLSDRTIASAAPARGVLEVVAGTARRLGLAPGDRVAHPWFEQR
jgi:uncharacterized protein